MNLMAWNAGSSMGLLLLAMWWHVYGQKLWANRGAECRECGRSKASCSCVDVVFTASDIFDDEDDE